LPKISELQRESRRQQILEAALACFSENGFHQTGIADIVRRSGMSHGAVYGYFQSKDDIIEALADDRHQREAALNAVVQKVQNPIDGLLALVRAYARSLIIGLVKKAQSTRQLPGDLSADAVARSFIALFQGFVLQVAWGEDIDVGECVAVVDRMLRGLALSAGKPGRANRGVSSRASL